MQMSSSSKKKLGWFNAWVSTIIPHIQYSLILVLSLMSTLILILLVVQSCPVKKKLMDRGLLVSPTQYSLVIINVHSLMTQTLKSLSQKYKESNRYPADAGILPINKKKNRFKDILPCKLFFITYCTVRQSLSLVGNYSMRVIN